MGCGCGSRSTAQNPGTSAASRRATVYQVLADGLVVSEHTTLPEARTAAVEAGGRVKVTSKILQ